MPNDFSNKEIERAIDARVRPLNFTKKGKKWRRTNRETICQITLAKDRWRPEQSYLDIEVSVVELNPPTSSEPNWHLVGRYYPNVEEKVEWEHCLNLRYMEVSGKPRQTHLVEILELKILPLLQTFETLDGIKYMLFSNQLRAMGVTTDLQKFTGYRA